MNFFGAWELVSYEQRLASGELLRPFGDAPSGLILYHVNGVMSAQISAGDRARAVRNDFFSTSADEAAAAWRTYFGYWGTFSVDIAKRIVVHRVEGGSFANWIGTEQVRHFRFDGEDRLVLEAPTEAGLFAVSWRRRSVRE